MTRPAKRPARRRSPRATTGPPRRKTKPASAQAAGPAAPATDAAPAAGLAAPASLAGAAKARWERVAPLLAAQGSVDRELLSTYCQVWARWRQAEDGLQKTGQLIKSPRGGVMASPLVALSGKALGQLRDLEKRLGLNETRLEGGSAPASTPQAGPLVDRVRLADILAVHPDTITHYAQKGMPVVSPGGRGRESAYDALACVAWWRGQQGGNAKDVAQTRAYEATAKLNEQRLAERRTEVVSRETVILAGQGYTKAWTAKVRSLPRRLVETGVITRDLEAPVAVVCREILTEIASWKTMADLTRTAKRAAS